MLLNARPIRGYRPASCPPVRLVAAQHQRVVTIALPRHPEQAGRIGMLVMDCLGPTCRAQVVNRCTRDRVGYEEPAPVQPVGHQVGSRRSRSGTTHPWAFAKSSNLETAVGRARVGGKRQDMIPKPRQNGQSERVVPRHKSELERIHTANGTPR